MKTSGNSVAKCHAKTEFDATEVSIGVVELVCVRCWHRTVERQTIYYYARSAVGTTIHSHVCFFYTRKNRVEMEIIHHMFHHGTQYRKRGKTSIF